MPRRIDPTNPESLLCSRPGQIERSAQAAVSVKRHHVRFPIGHSRQPGASACIQGSAQSSGWRRGRAETGSDPVRRPRGGRDERRSAADRVGPVCLSRREPPPHGLHPTHLGRHPVSPDMPGLVDRSEHRALRDSRCGRPRVYGALHPRGDGDGAHVSALAD
jgi:hypothetical protein